MTNRMTNRTMSRRSFLAVSAGVAAGAALSACAGGQTDTAASTASDLTTVSFVLDYSPNTNHTGIYVAKSLGYLAEEGVELDILPAPEDGAEALIGSGGASMGVSYQDYIANSLASGTPMPISAVAAVIQHNTSGIMSRADDGITRAAAMENHSYATYNGAVEQAIIKQIMQTDGGDFEKLELVPYSMSDDVSGLKAGLADCVWVYEGWAVQNAELQGFAYNYFSLISQDDVFDYYTPVIAVNDDFAAENADTVKAVLRALRRGYEYAVENPSDAADILLEEVPELDSALVHASAEFLAGEYISDAGAWGEIDPERWSAFYQWLNDNDLTENKLDVDAGYDLSFLA